MILFIPPSVIYCLLSANYNPSIQTLDDLKLFLFADLLSNEYYHLLTPSQACVVLFACTQPFLFPSLCQSKVCYVKAALPWTLELLSTHFHYVSSSENGQNVRALKSLILNIYSQQCAPVINEEEEVGLLLNEI